MYIIPAINLKEGACVALEHHQIDSATIYSNDLEDAVGRWFDKGVERLHLVDLDGAVAGQPINADLIRKVAFRFPNFSIQVSGGIRSLTDIEMYLNAGLDYVVLGTTAFQDPELIIKASLMFPGKIIVSIDSIDGKVCIEGRKKQTDVEVLEFIKQYDLPSVAGIVLSEVSTSVQGINVDFIAQVASCMSIPVIAASGIEDMDDVRAVFAESHKGISGIISSTALREGALDLVEAQAYCDEFED